MSVSLRPITYEDTPDIVRWRNNPRVRRFFVYRVTFTPEIHDRWLDNHVIGGARDAAQWIICETDETAGTRNRPVGSVYFRDIDRAAGTAEYGIFIGEDDAAGRGIGTIAAEEALKRAKSELGLDTIRLRAFADNHQAIRSYEKAGFTETQKLPGVQCSDGEVKDMIMMEKRL